MTNLIIAHPADLHCRTVYIRKKELERTEARFRAGRGADLAPLKVVYLETLDRLVVVDGEAKALAALKAGVNRIGAQLVPVTAERLGVIEAQVRAAAESGVARVKDLTGPFILDETQWARRIRASWTAAAVERAAA
jgi:hypothetical protein